MELKELSTKIKLSGIYVIINTLNNKIYIGSTNNLYGRLKCHFNKLASNKHVSPHLQNSYNKYGKNNFSYLILEYCGIDLLEQREQFYCNLLKPEYNIRPVARNNKGIPLSEAHKKKLSLAHKGKKKSPEHIEKLRKLKLGSKLSEEAKKKIALKSKGRKMPESHVQMLKNRNKEFYDKFHKRAIETTSKPVIHKETGIIYKSIAEAWRNIPMSRTSAQRSVKHNRTILGNTLQYWSK